MIELLEQLADPLPRRLTFLPQGGDVLFGQGVDLLQLLVSGLGLGRLRLGAVARRAGLAQGVAHAGDLRLQ